MIPTHTSLNRFLFFCWGWDLGRAKNAAWNPNDFTRYDMTIDALRSGTCGACFHQGILHSKAVDGSEYDGNEHVHVVDPDACSVWVEARRREFVTEELVRRV